MSKLQRILLAGILSALGCAATPHHRLGVSIDCGERFLLDPTKPHYDRLDITLVRINSDGSVVVKWDHSGELSQVALEQTATGPDGFFRLLASNPRAQVAVFETMWSE